MNEPQDQGFEAPRAEPGAGQPRDPSREWLSQLQAMIENLTTQAGPVAREIGAKAAELAAVAAEKAGPIAAKAAEVTADAGTRFAERSRNLATELRSQAEADSAHGGAAQPEPSAETSTAEPGSSGMSGATFQRETPEEPAD